MEKLLNWSVAASKHDPQQGPAPRPDEKALNELFGGANEAEQMQDALAVATNKEATVENREVALDNLEMLIEQLDNANNLENMQLWEPLLRLLDDESATIRKMTCWVVGTATQNNETSQLALGSKKDAIPTLIEMVRNDEDQEVRLKALYALSSSLGHCQSNYEQFEAAKGWDLLDYLFKTVDYSKLRMRILSFLQVVSTIEPVAPKHVKIQETDIIPSVIQIMGESDHVDAEEKALYVCSSLHSNGFAFSDSEITQIAEIRKKIIDKSEGGVQPDDVPFAKISKA